MRLPNVKLILNCDACKINSTSPNTKGCNSDVALSGACVCCVRYVRCVLLATLPLRCVVCVTICGLVGQDIEYSCWATSWDRYAASWRIRSGCVLKTKAIHAILVIFNLLVVSVGVESCSLPLFFRPVAKLTKSRETPGLVWHHMVQQAAEQLHRAQLDLFIAVVNCLRFSDLPRRRHQPQERGRVSTP